MTEAAGKQPARGAAWLEWLGLAASLTPFVVAVVRAVTTGWVPMGDAAYFTARSRDVFGPHWPLLGAWSSGSVVVGELVNNLGPLQFDLLAPFTKAPFEVVSPYLGTGIGAAAVNAGAVVLVWFTTRALVAPLPVALVSLGTTALVGTLGLSWLVDARQQFAMVLPFYAVLWLSLAMAAGVGWAVPWGAFVGSLVVQTHFTFGFQTVLALAVGAAAYATGVVAQRDRRWRSVVAWTVGVVVVCWIQPLIDQFAGTGNLGRVAGLDRSRGVGYETGLGLVGDRALTRPWSLRGVIRLDLEVSMRAIEGISPAGVVALVGWSSLALAVAVVGWRQRRRLVVACGLASLSALVGALVAAAAIPPTVVGVASQNYYWLVAVGAFVGCALPLGALSSSRPAVAARVERMRNVRNAAAAVAAVALIAFAAHASVPRYPVESARRTEVEARRVGRSFRAQLAATFATPGFPRRVEVDMSELIFGNEYPYVVLVELQRAGVEFRFVSGSGNLFRFGESRCVRGGRLPRVVLHSGTPDRQPPGSRLIAAVAGFTPADSREAARLQAYFGDRLREGAIEVEIDRVGGRLRPDRTLRRVLAEPGRPANGLATPLDAWRRLGAAHVPSSDLDALARWVELEQRPNLDNQYVVLENRGAAPERAADATTEEGPLRC